MYQARCNGNDSALPLARLPRLLRSLAVVSSVVPAIAGCEIMLHVPFVIARAAERHCRPSCQPPPQPYQLPKNTSMSTDIADSVQDILRADLLKVEWSSPGSRDSSGLVTATVWIDLAAPDQNQAKSYAMYVGVDCADGEIEVYRLQAYAENGAQGSPMHTQFAGFVQRAKPGPPLDKVVSDLCKAG